MKQKTGLVKISSVSKGDTIQVEDFGDKCFTAVWVQRLKPHIRKHPAHTVRLLLSDGRWFDGTGGYRVNRVGCHIIKHRKKEHGEKTRLKQIQELSTRNTYDSGI